MRTELRIEVVPIRVGCSPICNCIGQTGRISIRFVMFPALSFSGAYSHLNPRLNVKLCRANRPEQTMRSCRTILELTMTPVPRLPGSR
jgi:hypothetical protein